ncbi:helix-turn-helix domain-containing protein [Orientia tsutsugamushi]|uniref:helix-turn-helix domain-containing protein n=1 Tax=Orientia tsutsugamushi TaxID=784 RepID=UPI0005A078BE|nr:helix-turn-helix domain-containing protein [Orientia tsutsugamushi]
MPKSYRQDFRDKVMKCVNRGKSCNATSVKFDIAANTVRNWYKRYKSEGHYNRQFRIRKSMKSMIQKACKRYYVISLNIVSINNSLFIARMSVNANLG